MSLVALHRRLCSIKSSILRFLRWLITFLGNMQTFVSHGSGPADSGQDERRSETPLSFTVFPSNHIVRCRGFRQSMRQWTEGVM